MKEYTVIINNSRGSHSFKVEALDLERAQVAARTYCNSHGVKIEETGIITFLWGLEKCTK